ncbi:MAG: penicillin-binding protein 1C [Candidatus Binatia bacterium]
MIREEPQRVLQQRTQSAMQPIGQHCSWHALTRIVRGTLIGLGLLYGGFLFLNWRFPFPIATVHRQPAAVVTDHTGVPLRIFLPPDEQLRFPVTIDQVASVFLQTLIASEDRWFYAHPGVNPFAIARALWSNVRAGRIVSGASTISMQIARMAEPKPRTLWAKGQEVFRALQLERLFTKEQLLELYLNLTPYGGNIEGIGAATSVYFGKSPMQLSLGEAALLAALPRSPNLYNPARNSDIALTVRNRVLQQLARDHVFSAQAIADASQHPVRVPHWRPPFIAPHFCQFVVDRSSPKSHIITTLDRRIQQIAEEQVAAHISMLNSRGINSTAVIVIENDTRAVRAMIGSPDFFATTYEGQVNSAVARRSPGSALKPFLYAMAIDTGLVLPTSYLLDVPTDFAGYVPENYDGQYSGRVTVSESLIRSLNAPAVRLLAQIGLTEFHQLLKRGGLTTLDRPTTTYGLPLILGSGEVTLLDLTNLYATLAAGGIYRPAQVQVTDPSATVPEDRLFSPETAHVITRILTGLQRPDLPRAWHLTRDVPVVAWKTGTSYGHRDAWSLGFSSRYTIGVWVGNVDGRGQKGLAGAEHAAPLLFDLFRTIEQGPAQFSTREDLQLATVNVCALSHELAGPYCPLQETVLSLPGRSKLSFCSYHRRVFVDSITGDLLNGSCLASRPHHAEVLTVYPSEFVAWRQVRGEPIAVAPRLSPACNNIPTNDPLKIISPNAATPYFLRRDTPREYQQIPLIVQGGTSAEQLYWYQDGTLIERGSPATSLFLPLQPGTHRLVVVDNTGRSDSLSYTVEHP